MASILEKIADEVASRTLARQNAAVLPVAVTQAMSSGVSPDTEAEYYRLSKETGVPLGLLRNGADLTTRIIQKQQQVEELAQTHPATAEFLSNRDNAAVAHDDVHNLSAAEQLLRPWAAMGSNVMSGASRFAEGGNQLIDLGQKVSEGLGFGRSKMFDNITENSREHIRQSDQFWNDISQHYGSDPRSIVSQVFTGIGEVPKSFVDWTLGVPYAAAKGYDQNGIPGAIVEGVKRFGLGKVFEAIGNTGMSQVQRAFTMGGTMGAQTAAEQVITPGGIQGNDVTAQAITGVMLGFGGGGGKQDAIHQDMIKAGVDPEHASVLSALAAVEFEVRDSRSNAERLLNLANIGKNSKLNARLPDMFKQFIDSVRHEDLSYVRIPLDTFERLAESSGKPLDKLLDHPNDYQLAKMTGNEVPVPFSTVVSDFAAHLKPDDVAGMRARHDGLTLNEAIAEREKSGNMLSDHLNNVVTKIDLKNAEISPDNSFDSQVELTPVRSEPLTVTYQPDHSVVLSFASPPSAETIKSLESNRFKQSENGTWTAQGSGTQRRAFIADLHSDLLTDIPEQSNNLPIGPGAMTEASTHESGSDITQLASSLNDFDSIKKRMEVGRMFYDSINGAKNTAVSALENLKGISQGIWSAYTKPPEWTDFKRMIGEYQGARQKSSWEVTRFAKKIQETMPKEIQEGVTNWIEAGGDVAELERRAEASGNLTLRQGYKKALELTEEQRLFADNVRNYFDSRLDQAIKSGVVDAGVEDYVNHVWERDSAYARMIKGEVNAGLLQTNPALAKERVFSTFFGGEQMGLTPKDKRIGYLLAAYDKSMNEAIAARAFVKQLLEGKAADGRPLASVSGSGKPIIDEDITKSFIIRPKTRPEEAADYLPIDHPVLRKWKFIGSDSASKPILMQGDVLIHPEIYRHLKNVLGRSAIREFQFGGYKLGKILLDGIQELKSTLLSLSAFHQVQEGVHAVGHTVNPFNAPDLDFENPVQLHLINHGLMIYNHSGMQEFTEGLHASGLVNKLPVVGHVMNRYSEYLFQGYIPRLKMEMALHALTRNTERYKGTLNPDQIAEITARQANAAFGGLNYDMIGRNKTIQDVFRLAVLAPDFLEARLKFVGQALKPYGMEQGTALVRLAAYMAVTAQVSNYIINGEFEWSHPFSIKINGKYYTLRSIPGDIIHLVHDPRTFTYHRLNPTIARPVIEGLTGRDSFGRRRGFETQMVDWIKGQVPIPIQGPLWQDDYTLLDSVLQSTGIGSSRK